MRYRSRETKLPKKTMVRRMIASPEVKPSCRFARSISRRLKGQTTLDAATTAREISFSKRSSPRNFCAAICSGANKPTFPAANAVARLGQRRPPISAARSLSSISRCFAPRLRFAFSPQQARLVFNSAEKFFQDSLRARKGGSVMLILFINRSRRLRGWFVAAQSRAGAPASPRRVHRLLSSGESFFQVSCFRAH